VTGGDHGYDTLVARPQAISLVWHPAGYPGFCGAARVCAPGRSKWGLAATEVPGQGFACPGDEMTPFPPPIYEEGLGARQGRERACPGYPGRFRRWLGKCGKVYCCR
jgi:hypothetical protein